MLGIQKILEIQVGGGSRKFGNSGGSGSKILPSIGGWIFSGITPGNLRVLLKTD